MLKINITYVNQERLYRKSHIASPHMNFRNKSIIVTLIAQDAV